MWSSLEALVVRKDKNKLSLTVIPKSFKFYENLYKSKALEMIYNLFPSEINDAFWYTHVSLLSFKVIHFLNVFSKRIVKSDEF